MKISQEARATMPHIPISRQYIRKSALALTGVLMVLLLLSACGGDPQVQQQANQNKTAFDHEISYARSIGVPGSMLQPIISQATQLNASSAPLSIFNDQSGTNYNSNLAQRYQMLTVETKGLET